MLSISFPRSSIIHLFFLASLPLAQLRRASSSCGALILLGGAGAALHSWIKGYAEQTVQHQTFDLWSIVRPLRQRRLWFGINSVEKKKKKKRQIITTKILFRAFKSYGEI
jgi:fucose permease